MENFRKKYLLVILISWFPISFLMIRHGVHISLYAIFLLYAYTSIKGIAPNLPSKESICVAASLASIFIATITQQIISTHADFSAWDGPSRLLIAGLVLLYLRQQNINYTKILEFAIPAGLILLCIYLSINSKYYWGHRWANLFVDPNSLGSQSTILSMICLLSIRLTSQSYINILKIIGAISGFYISIKAESRGGWAAIPLMTLCWFLIQLKQINFWSNKKHTIKIISTLALLIIGITAIVIFIDPVKNRLVHTVFEINTWFKDPTIYTSAGTRMSMWIVAIQLIQENFWGYGDIAIKEILSNHPLHTSIYLHGVNDMIMNGPHSDILSKGLSLGIAGIAAYLLTILTPITLFFSKIKSQDLAIQKAAHIGLLYVTGVLVVGLFNETLSLKYLCSFYGLMIACLAAQVLYKPNIDPTSKAL
ncbi:O-antigen ligase family protein [Polynucleobacter sp. MWH-Spelu-300-X4]|uniref:O-antigen ligase family protein n=1 Tax=Polynucleobacter sp. MWH-Spelu-300-X4 TaxID=2689109 RepID=UPI001BFEACD4|nr:O-antigen ligase family protein [Polynucleobacter sp. MWH-Spelu-300-X4]QWD80065.1 O-antigen ligase family protein [Polynucleobacter sp. MWH-Spelu-300-X4]